MPAVSAAQERLQAAVSVHAPAEDWRGAFVAPWGRYAFDRAYSKSEWENWMRYLTALGATADEAKETMQVGRLHGPAKAAERCAAESGGVVTQSDLMHLLNEALAN